MAWRAGNLARLAKQRGWMLIPLLAVVGKRIVPDGTIRDGNGLPRAYWEAKDTSDDLDVEIQKKKAKGYPLQNIIFEDTLEAVLYQGGVQALRVTLRDRNQFAQLLVQFFSISSPTSKVSKPPSLNSRTACPIWPRAYSRR
jgi:hypothetical protein